MGKLIDVDVAIRAAVEYIEDWNRAKSIYHRRELTKKFIALPPVDAVPVVRCKDCIYPYICGVEMYCDHITGEEILVQPHEFCCWGVRKDGDNG